MNISNIQMTQGMIQSLEGKTTSGRGNLTAESKDVSRQETILPDESQNKITTENSKLFQEQKNVFEIFYPPMFPIGNTQGIYSAIMQSQPEPSAADVLKEQQADKSGRNPNAGVLRPDVSDGKKSAETVQQTPKTAVDPGSVLDLTV